MKRFISIICISLLLIITFVYAHPFLLPKPIYITSFPEEESDGFLNMLLYYGNSPTALTIEEVSGEREISSVYSQNDTYYMSYSTVTDEMIYEHFKPVYGKRDYGKQFRELSSSFKDLLGENNNLTSKKNYPEIIIETDNSITISSFNNEQTFTISELLSQYGRKNSDFFTIEVPQIDDEAFLITIRFTDSQHYDLYHIFIKNDLSHFVVVDGEEEPFTEHIHSGDLEDFSNLLFKAELNERYAIVSGLNVIYDRDKDHLIPIDEKDVLSEDGQYVYLNGNDSVFKQGKQKIQATKDYIEGNNSLVHSFRMNFRQIANQYGMYSLALDATSSAKVVYFNGDYIMYSFSYNAIYFGSAGNLNVIVDLQDDSQDPTFYLFDFGITI